MQIQLRADSQQPIQPKQQIHNTQFKFYPKIDNSSKTITINQQIHNIIGERERERERILGMKKGRTEIWVLTLLFSKFLV